MAKVRCRLIVLAAGEGKRFQQVGYKDPKPFIEILGMRMLDLVIRNMRDQLKLSPEECPVTVVTQQSFGELPFELSNGEVIQLAKTTSGAAETAKIALESLPNDGKPVIICNCDQFVTFDGKEIMAGLEADETNQILTFEDPTMNPKWSYVELSPGTCLVKRVAEKVPISTTATVGVYGYVTKDVAIDAIDSMMKANDRFNNEFYLCPAFNYVRHFFTCSEPVVRMWGLGTPEDFDAALRDEVFINEVDRIR
jgi:NDP-sugar pyrophosphorylase family protein